MNKQQMLDAIENAKQIHLAQMSKIEDVIAGKKIDKPTPLGKMECDCGVWFYAHEENLRKILGAQLFDKLDANHEKWHRDYVSVYNILFKEEKKGFFSKLIGGDKLDDMTLDRVKLYFADLKQDTDELLRSSEAAKRRVAALSDTKFS